MVEEFYNRIGTVKCQRMRDPTVEQLDAVLAERNFTNFAHQEGNRSFKNEAVFIYYIGHGVEFNNHTHAVLHNGANIRVKYDLEKMTNRIGRLGHTLVHVMFDCNRLYWQNEKPLEVKKWPKKAHFIHTYSTYAGRQTKALNSVNSYVEHLQSQITDCSLKVPYAVGLLNGLGSFNCVHNMAGTYSVYVYQEEEGSEELKSEERQNQGEVQEPESEKVLQQNVEELKPIAFSDIMGKMRTE